MATRAPVAVASHGMRSVEGLEWPPVMSEQLVEGQATAHWPRPSARLHRGSEEGTSDRHNAPAGVSWTRRTLAVRGRAPSPGGHSSGSGLLTFLPGPLFV